MDYVGKLVAYESGLSRLSCDKTPWPCEVEGCTNYVNHILTVPGEHIGKPGRTYHVLRCLNCLMWTPFYVYYDEMDQPVRAEYDLDDTECQEFLEDYDQTVKPVSIVWSPIDPDRDKRFMFDCPKCRVWACLTQN